MNLTPTQQQLAIQQKLFKLTISLEHQLREHAEGVLKDFTLKFETLGYDAEFEKVIQEQRLWKMNRLEQLRTKIYTQIKKSPYSSK